MNTIKQEQDILNEIKRLERKQAVLGTIGSGLLGLGFGGLGYRIGGWVGWFYGLSIVTGLILWRFYK